MPKYEVPVTVTYEFTMVIEADNAEEAVSKAESMDDHEVMKQNNGCGTIQVWEDITEESSA